MTIRSQISILSHICFFIIGSQSLAHAQVDAPSEQAARELLTTLAQSQSEGKLRLASFRKVDGIRREIFGTPIYELEFEAEVEVMEDLKWLTTSMFQAVFTGFRTALTKAQSERQGGMWAGWFNMTQNSGMEYRGGTVVRVAGSLRYERSERGWRLAQAPEMRPLEGERQTSAPSNPAQAPVGQRAPIPGASKRFASLQELVPGGTIGTFQHGSEVSGCYGPTQLLAIQLRDRPFASTLNCTRTRALVHAGIDVVAPQGTQVRAIAHGTVTDVIATADDPSFRALGYAVVLRHLETTAERPTWSLYLHFDGPPSVNPGDQVVAGETVLGLVGRTGTAFGYHTHIEVRHFPERISPQWRNIYAVEEAATQGGTFDSAQFEANWQDPMALLSAGEVAATDPSASSADQLLTEGYELYQRGEHSSAATVLGKAAAGGDARAAGLLGFMYMQGMGVEWDANKAIAHLTMAADAGSPGAAFNLGDIYWDGRGIRRNQTRAAQWYAKALEGYLKQAAGGDLESMAMAGRIYAEGGGVKANPAEAVRWLTQAADRNYPKAQRLLGQLHVQGLGIPRNRAEGVRLLQLAAQAGDGTAQDQLRRLGERW